MTFFFRSKPKHKSASEVARPAGCTTFEVVSGANMPNMDGVRGISDCYVLASLVDSKTGAVLAGTEVVKTTTRQDSLDPTWFTYVSFPVAVDSTDMLKLDVFDEDQLSKDDHIGSALIEVGKLSTTKGAPVVAALTMVTHVKTKSKLPSTVTVRHVSTVAWDTTSAGEGVGDGCATPPPPVKKTLFLIRHGESKWNEAQASKDVKNMLRQYDHELDHNGIQQARDFNAKWKALAAGEKGAGGAKKGVEVETKADSAAAGTAAAGASAGASVDTSTDTAVGDVGTGGPDRRLAEFLSAGAFYASPLTRATETALLTCQGHPYFDTAAAAGAAAAAAATAGAATGGGAAGGGGELKLSRAVREVKSTPMGSLDTIGERKGHEIAAHVAKCLEADGGDGLDVEKVMRGVNIVPRDSTGHWWTSLELKDTKEMQRVRFRDTFAMLRHDNQAAVVVVVGHSLFFRNLVREHLSDEFKASQPELAAELASKKLGNAACLCVEVEWAAGGVGAAGGNTAMAPPKITNAELVFGSGFHEHSSRERPSSAASGKAAAVND